MPPQLEQEERGQVAALGLRAAAPQRLKKARAPFACAAAWREIFEQQMRNTNVSGDATAPHAARAVHHDTPTRATSGGAPVHAALEPGGARLGACGIRRRVLLHRANGTELRRLRRNGERVCHTGCGERGVIGYRSDAAEQQPVLQLKQLLRQRRLRHVHLRHAGLSWRRRWPRRESWDAPRDACALRDARAAAGRARGVVGTSTADEMKN